MMNVRKTIHKLYEETLRAQYGSAGLRDPDDRGGRLRRGAEPAAPRRPVQAPGAAAKTMKALADEMDATAPGGSRRASRTSRSTVVREEAA